MNPTGAIGIAFITTVVGESVAMLSELGFLRMVRHGGDIMVGGSSCEGVVALRFIADEDTAANDKLLCLGVILLLVVETSASASTSGSCCGDNNVKECRNDRTTDALSCFFFVLLFVVMPPMVFTTLSGTSVGIVLASPILKQSLPLLPQLLLPLLPLYSHDAIGMMAGIDTDFCCDCDCGDCNTSSSSTDSESDWVMDNSSMVGSDVVVSFKFDVIVVPTTMR